MEQISHALFWISNGLLVPVIVLLLLLLLRALLLLGGFFGEFYQRMKLQKTLAELLEAMTPDNARGQLSLLPEPRNHPLLRSLKKLEEHDRDAAYCERLLANYEVDAEKELGRSRMFVKLGPMLGLMGTLIPMGPALVSLAGGDISSMAYNMQVAFATTVVGMLIAAIGVITLQIKQRWYAREWNDLEFVYRKLSEEDEKKPVVA